MNERDQNACPPIEDIARCLASPREFDNERNAASWLLSQQRDVIGDEQFVREVLDFTYHEGRLLVAAVRWDVAARWTPPPAVGRAERALYQLTMSLAVAGQPVELGAVLTRLRLPDVKPALAACAWATGRIDLSNTLRGPIAP